MFQIYTSWIYFDHHQAIPSTWSVFRSTMKVWFIHCSRMTTPALYLHDLFTPRMTNMVWIHYRTLRVSLRSQGSHQDVATWCSTSAITSPQSWEKLTSNGNFTNSITLTMPNVVSMRPKKKHVTGDPDLEIWLTPSIE
jgi:hypothetical protein